MSWITTPREMQPGVAADLVAPVREVLLKDGPMGPMFWPLGAAIDGSKSRDPDNPTRVDILRAGLLMGRITGGNKYAPSVLGTLQSAYAGSGTSLILGGVGQVTEIGRRIGATGTFKITGPPTAAGKVRTKTATYSALGGGSGVNEVQTIAWSATPTAGTFTITFKKSDGTYVTTAAIAYGATCSTTVANAINAVLGTSAVSCTATSSTTADNGFYLTFSGTGYTHVAQEACIVNADGITAPVGVTGAVTRTTAGVPAGQYVTITALGTAQVQCIKPSANPTVGSCNVLYLGSDDVQVSVAVQWNDAPATIQTALRAAHADLAAVTVAQATGAAGLSDCSTSTGITVTWPQTGATAGEHNLFWIVQQPTMLATAAKINVVVSETTAGVQGDFVAGSLIQPADGSENIQTIYSNKYGQSVLNALLQSIDVQYPDILLGGAVRTAMVINYPSDTSLIAYIKASLRSYGGVWFFDDDFIGASI